MFGMDSKINIKILMGGDILILRDTKSRKEERRRRESEAVDKGRPIT